MSVDPPGGYTTTILILPAGPFWACTVNGTTSAPRSRYRLESMRMNMLPEKLRLCRNDGFEAGPVVNRGCQCSTPRFYGPVIFVSSQKQPMTGFGTCQPRRMPRRTAGYGSKAGAEPLAGCQSASAHRRA